MLTEKYKALDPTELGTSPEEVLWISAIWHSYFAAVRGDQREVKWLTQEIEPQRIGSFHWICQALNICPKTLRNRFIQNWDTLIKNKAQEKGMRTIREVGNGYKYGNS